MKFKIILTYITTKIIFSLIIILFGFENNIYNYVLLSTYIIIHGLFVLFYGFKFNKIIFYSKYLILLFDLYYIVFLIYDIYSLLPDIVELEGMAFIIDIFCIIIFSIFIVIDIIILLFLRKNKNHIIYNT